MKTITIDGVEYQLVPVTPSPETTINHHSSPLDDFAVAPPPEPAPQPEEPMEPPSNVDIIDATQKDGVQKAVPKSSDYRSRFLEKKLNLGDIAKVGNRSTEMLKNFKDAPEIRANDSRNGMPTGKYGFYGPGIEFDIA